MRKEVEEKLSANATREVEDKEVRLVTFFLSGFASHTKSCVHTTF